MSVLLQISDSHFGTEVPNVVEALVKLAHDQQPDLVVLSGDITQRARKHQFAAARAFVDRLASRAVLAIPGNHDIPLFNLPARIFAPYAGYQRCFGPDLEPTYEGDDLLVVGVKTTRRYRHKDGEISREQVERVAERLHQAQASQLRIVVVHQPVFAIRESDKDNLLGGRKRALAAWSAAGCDIIMGGHIHLPYVRPLRAAYPAMTREVWTVQAGTAVSSRIREDIPNSINIVRFDAAQAPRACVMERWDFDAVSECFALHSAQTIAFDAAPETSPAVRQPS